MTTKRTGSSKPFTAQPKQPVKAKKRIPRYSKPINPRLKHYNYTDEDRAAALVYLQSNHWQIRTSARDLGIPHETLRQWALGNGLTPVAREKYREIKGSLSSKLEDIAHQLIDAIPDTIPNASLKDLGAILAVVIDKMRLLREEPTAISESMDRRAMLECLIERTMKEFPGMTREEVIDIIRDVKPEAIKFLS